MSKIVDYVDKRGIKRRVKLPNDESDPIMGIPVDVYDILEIEIYDNAPFSFKTKFYHALWSRGLIEPNDFEKRNASELYAQAIRSACKLEANSAIRTIKEFVLHD